MVLARLYYAPAPRKNGKRFLNFLPAVLPFPQLKIYKGSAAPRPKHENPQDYEALLPHLQEAHRAESQPEQEAQSQLPETRIKISGTKARRSTRHGKFRKIFQAGRHQIQAGRSQEHQEDGLPVHLHCLQENQLATIWHSRQAGRISINGAHRIWKPHPKASL